MSRTDSKKIATSFKRRRNDSPFLSDEELELPPAKIIPPEIKKDPVLISIFTQKGGVGKTTSTFNFACLLAKKYNIKVLMVDADPQCNLTAIGLKRQVLENYKKNSSMSKKCKSSSASSSKEESKGDSKEDSKDEVKYQPARTRGEGDCPFHALLGTWNGVENEYVCPEVESKRFEVKKAILAMDDKEDARLKKLVYDGIQALVMRAPHQHVGKQIKKMSKLYEKYKLDSEFSSPQIWQAFEVELKKNPTILEYVNKYGKLKQQDTLRNRFAKALNSRENLLYGIIFSIPELQIAFQVYNNLTSAEFDWDAHVNRQAIEEYAAFIETPGQSLLPLELDILAHVFGKTIELYPTRRATQFQTLNEGHGVPVKIQFNGINHYERMEQVPLSPISRDDRADNDELILSDELDQLYKEDEYFFQPIGESDPDGKIRLAKRDESKVDNFYKILALIESHKQLMTKGLPNVIKEVVLNTRLKKLETLDENGNLFLLPSSMDMYLIDNKLTALITGSQNFEATRQFVFAPADYVRALAYQYQFDIVLIDLSPNIGGLNQSLMLFSDYFMMPGVPDFFTNQAVSSIARALPRWASGYAKIDDRPLAKFVSLYMQKVKVICKNVAEPRKKRIEKIGQTLHDKLLPVLRERGMTIADENYKDIPIISQISDTSLVNAENEGLPIGCVHSYPGFKILKNNKENYSRYQKDFISVIQQSFGLIVKSDHRLKRLRDKFIISGDTANEQISSFVEDINKPHDIEQIISSEMSQESTVGNADLYPQSITSLLKFLFALRMKYPLVFFAFPYAFPDGDIKNTHYLKDLDKNFVKKAGYTTAVISFYLKLNWLLMIIEFKKRNTSNQFFQIEKIHIYRNEAKDFANKEEEVALSIVNQYNDEKQRAVPIVPILHINNEHPANVLKNYLTKKFDPSKRSTKTDGPETIRKLLLQSITDPLSKKDMAEIKNCGPLHRQYINDLSIEFKNKMSFKFYNNFIKTLTQSIPGLIQGEFPILTKIIILSAISSCLDESEMQMKKVEEIKKSTKKKKKKKNKNTKEEQVLNPLNTKLSNFLGLLFDRNLTKKDAKIEEDSSRALFSPTKRRKVKTSEEIKVNLGRMSSPLTELTVLRPLGTRQHRTRSELMQSKTTSAVLRKG